jgi:hypothetical protein
MAEVLRIQSFERNPQPFFLHFTPCRTQVLFRDPTVGMEPLNTLITLVKLTFGRGMDRDTRSLKQAEIVLSPQPEKGTDNTPRLRVND